MRELEYCRIYANGFIKITTLNVTIDVLGKDNPFKLKERISLRLSIKGYPNKDERKITSYMDYPTAEGAQKSPNGEMKYRDGADLKKAMKEVRKSVK